ncbi:MAG: hypothetical protein K0S94_2906 [Nitrospira sp.]|nr:hypothetical protein [Nitrospira sp.]
MTIEDVIAYAIEHTPQANAVIAALASKGYRSAVTTAALSFG